MDWLDIAAGFENKWQFPHCLGAIDGKHVQIIPPKESGSYYFNYKKTHSIVLMAIANANREFIYCSVGTNGRVSDWVYLIFPFWPWWIQLTKCFRYLNYIYQI